MSLLSPQDDAEIRAAVKLVTDTFMVNPIEYYIPKESLDRFQEDRGTTYTKYDINGLAEYGYNDADAKMQEMQGDKDWGKVTLTFNVEDAIAAGLVTNTDFTTIMKSETDYLKFKGKFYEVVDVYFDGPLSQKDVLLIVKAKLTEKIITV